MPYSILVLDFIPSLVTDHDSPNCYHSFHSAVFTIVSHTCKASVLALFIATIKIQDIFQRESMCVNVEKCNRILSKHPCKYYSCVCLFALVFVLSHPGTVLVWLWSLGLLFLDDYSP